MITTKHKSLNIEINHYPSDCGERGCDSWIETEVTFDGTSEDDLLDFLEVEVGIEIQEEDKSLEFGELEEKYQDQIVDWASDFEDDEADDFMEDYYECLNI